MLLTVLASRPNQKNNGNPIKEVSSGTLPILIKDNYVWTMRRIYFISHKHRKSEKNHQIWKWINRQVSVLQAVKVLIRTRKIWNIPAFSLSIPKLKRASGKSAILKVPSTINISFCRDRKHQQTRKSHYYHRRYLMPIWISVKKYSNKISIHRNHKQVRCSFRRKTKEFSALNISSPK